MITIILIMHIIKLLTKRRTIPAKTGNGASHNCCLCPQI